jgi:hypothetical protein
MQDISNRLHGCTVFSKINLVKGYYQIPVAAADLPKRGIITPFGFVEYLFMPFFGLSNPRRLQCMMDRTLDGLEGTFPRTFATWKPFSQHWPPKVSESTWTNVFLPFQLWNSLVTTFRRQDRPCRPITTHDSFLLSIRWRLN